MNCQRCGGGRIVDICAKCSDCCSCSLANDGKKCGNGYVPGDMGVGGGDYVEFSLCLDCGQVQAEFPVAETELERFVPMEPPRCPGCGSDEVFEYARDRRLCHRCGRVSGAKERQ